MCWPKILLPCPGLASIREGHACDLISKYFLTYLKFPVWELLYSMYLISPPIPPWKTCGGPMPEQLWKINKLEKYKLKKNRQGIVRLMIYSCIIPYHHFIAYPCVCLSFGELCSRKVYETKYNHRYTLLRGLENFRLTAPFWIIGGMMIVIEKVVDE